MRFDRLVSSLVLALAMAWVFPASGQSIAAKPGAIVETARSNGGAHALNVRLTNGHAVHAFPSVTARAIRPDSGDPGPLLYNGGPIMATATIYTIFWAPPKLPTGATATMSAGYISLQNFLASHYSGPSIGSNNNQYYYLSGTTKIFNRNAGSFGGSYTDVAPYPASDCADSKTPGNCLTDSDVQTEILKVMTLNGWTASSTRIFMLFTAKGEGECMDSTNQSCSYANFCGYHSYILNGTPVIYTYQPYGLTNYCQVPGTPTPQGNAEAEAAMSIATHEITEAITDPYLNAWYTSQGNEIADLCAYQYGPNTWDSGMANQYWFGKYIEVQMTYDNHVGGCVQAGP